MTKPELRQEMRRRLAAVTPEQRIAACVKLMNNLLALPQVHEARTVMVYLAMASEPDLATFIGGALDEDKTVAVPRVSPDGSGMTPVRLRHAADVRTGWRNLAEPAGDEAVPLGELDAVLVPGLAFTPDGRRLGRGGGFYDRLLADPSLRAARIGVCYAMQLVDDLPTDPHDQRVACVVTDATDCLGH